MQLPSLIAVTTPFKELWPRFCHVPSIETLIKASSVAVLFVELFLTLFTAFFLDYNAAEW